MKPEIAYVYDKLKQLRFDFKESDRKLFPNEYTFDYGLDRYIRKDGNDLYISKDTFKPLEEELEYADKCHKLEEEAGCHLDVVFKALRKGIYDYNGNHYGVSLKYSAIHNDFKLKDLLNGRLYSLENYKKTWWLKKDKSE